MQIRKIIRRIYNKLLLAFAMLLCIHVGLPTRAQLPSNEKQSYPIIGQRCPDFLLDDVINYKTTHLSLNDLKGQYFILDFWAQSCIGCILSFPHSNEIQKKFVGKLNMILVGYADNKKKIKSLFKNLSEKETLHLTCAFDTAVNKQFLPSPYGMLPSLVWVDKEGVVVAVTGAEDLTEWKINQFITGKPFTFYDMSVNSQRKERKVEENPKNFQSNGDDSTIIYRSEVKEWKPGMGFLISSNLNQKNTKIKQYHSNRATLRYLFETAFFQPKDWQDTSINMNSLLELKDSSYFFRYGTEIRYCYSLQAPGNESIESFKIKVKNELQNYFECKAGIEERETTCLFLRVSDREKLKQYKSNGIKADSLNHWDHGEGGELFNQSMSSLALILNGESLIKVIDQTHVEFKVDFPLYAVTTNPQDLRRALNKYGLDLVRGSKRLKTIVISN